VASASTGCNGLKYAILAERVSKRIKGRVILEEVTLNVPEGAVYVLAGPNGSGKTTTIRILLGLVRRDTGRVEILGRDPEVAGGEIRAYIGYLPEDAQPYERLTGLEHILFYARLYARSSNIEDIVSRAVNISGLELRDLNSRAGAYSRGMKRRLLLSLTLMHNPRVAVLDEPLSGLDVVSSYRVKKIIKSMAGGGTTFLITTHDMRDAEELADVVGLMVNGRLVAEGSPRELMESTGAESLEEAYVRLVGERV
jgi:ABC-2 type transport system ATP-binding protein